MIYFVVNKYLLTCQGKCVVSGKYSDDTYPVSLLAAIPLKRHICLAYNKLILFCYCSVLWFFRKYSITLILSYPNGLKAIVDNASLQADTLKTFSYPETLWLPLKTFVSCLSKSCKYLISEVVLRSLYDFHSLWIMTFLMAKMTVGIYFQQKAVLLLTFVY